MRLATTVLAAVLLTACDPKNQINPRLSAEMPSKMIWAWERREDLRFLDPKEFGVAFLSQTLFLEKNDVIVKARKQPLELPDGIYVIAVTRIETNKVTADRPTFDDAMVSKVASLIDSTRELPNVKGIQVDFDAVASERDFYRSMMKTLRTNIPAPTPLTMTSLASWCTGDAWFNDFPVDEAVPMAFQMGADSEKIRVYLQNGNDWSEPLCRGSYGVSVDERQLEGLKPGRRIYYFKNVAWDEDSVPLADIAAASDVVDVSSACELAANPEKFDGKTVRFKGGIVNGMEARWLDSDACPERQISIVVSRESRAADQTIADLKPTSGSGRVDGVITGVFKNKAFANCCTKAPYKIELVAIDNATRTR